MAAPGQHRRTDLTHHVASHHNILLLAAWLEGSGPALYVIFALPLVHLAGAKAGRAGRVTALASAALLAVSMAYDVTLIAIARSAALGGRQTTTALIAYGPFAATGHLFLIAPPLLLPLGLILLRTPLLPRIRGWLAVIAGVLGLKASSDTCARSVAVPSPAATSGHLLRCDPAQWRAIRSPAAAGVMSTMARSGQNDSATSRSRMPSAWPRTRWPSAGQGGREQDLGRGLAPVYYVAHRDLTNS